MENILPESVIFRRATESDGNGILKCLASAFAPHRDSYTPGAYLDTVLSEETLNLRFSSMHIFVAVGAGAQIVGTIACAVSDGAEGHLRGMAVQAEYQGRGIAEGLLSTAEADLAQQNCNRITLDTTEPLQRAIRFYEKHGYRRSGKTIDFFGMPLHEYVKDI